MFQRYGMDKGMVYIAILSTVLPLFWVGMVRQMTYTTLLPRDIKNDISVTCRNDAYLDG